MNRKPLNFFVKHLLIAIGVLIAVVIITLIGLSLYTKHGKQEIVPSVKNMTLNEASILLGNNNLQYEIIDSIYNRAMPPGYVTDQDPKAQSVVKKNRKIYLTINALGVQLIPLPNVLNMSLRQAKSLIEASDLVIRKIEYTNSEFRDLVLQVKFNHQAIKHGENIPAGSGVVLVVGNGFNGELAKVPSLVGLSYDKAIQLANKQGFNLEDPQFDEIPLNSVDENKYIIYRQEPRTNAMLSTGSFIKIWMSKTPSMHINDDADISLEEDLLF